jgi:predicted outer membrane protein
MKRTKTRMKFLCPLVLLALGSLFQNSGFAQEELSKMQNGPGTYKVSSLDQVVLSKIHAANTSEIKAAQWALKKSSSPEVKQVAQQIIKDHSDADKQVKEVARADNIRLLVPLIPQNEEEKKMIQEHKEEMAHLQTLKGNPFDTEYQRMMVAAHKRDVAELTSVQPKLKNENARDLVQNLIPKFQHHEHLIADLNLNPSTKTAQNEPQSIPQ